MAAPAGAKDYVNFLYYLGDMSRDQACAHLKGAEKGTFLVRDSSKAGSLVVSVAQTDKVLHLLLVPRIPKGWSVDPKAWGSHDLGRSVFPTVAELVGKLIELNMLKKGLTLEAIQEKLGAQGKAELKRVLSLNSVSHLESEYKGMITAMLMDKRIVRRELDALEAWRKKNDFTEEQHQKILKALGLTPEQWERLVAEADAPDDKELCVICLSAPRGAAFVPCGHLSSCMACAEMLTDCPICRRPISRVLRVFA